MTTVSSIPGKFVIPFAQNDGARVEIPATTADPTRASQSLGFPPLTMLPPESGGVPPQGEDFNGAVNQIARGVWWRSLLGAQFPYDNAFATNANIGGYPQGTALATADLLGMWISTVDNNVVNPDTTGTGWVPGYQYGTTAITGLTNVNVTLTPAQASKQSITFSGTLTGNVQIFVPTWLYTWRVINLTSGAFTLTFKTAAGTGIVVPQNGAITTLRGDGTNIIQDAPNTAAATTNTQVAQFGQVNPGRIINIQIVGNSGTVTRTGNASIWDVLMVSDGGGGGGAPAAAAGQIAIAGSGGGGGTIRAIVASPPTSATAVVGIGGAAGTAGSTPGSAGSGVSLTGTGFSITCPGGGGGTAGVSLAPPYIKFGVSGTRPSATGCTILYNTSSPYGEYGIGLNASQGKSGSGGASTFGAGAQGVSSGAGNGANQPGAGGSGGVSLGGGAAAAGGGGAQGIIIIYEYA